YSRFQLRSQIRQLQVVIAWKVGGTLYNRCVFAVQSCRRVRLMNWKSRLLLGVLTAIAMMLGTYLLPRGGTLRDLALAQFPTTVGVWAIFVLLFVKLK